MGILSRILFGKDQYPLKKKEKKALEKKEREAYLKGLTTGRVQRAKKLGLEKGTQIPKSRLGKIGSLIEGGGTGAKSYMEMIGLSSPLDLGLEPRQKKTKKKRGSKGTTIQVDGTTITIGTKRKKKK